MSVKPHWSELIRTGVKTVELRRRRCGCEPGTALVIYTSFPVKRVEAVATVKTVHALTPASLWRAVGARSAVSYDEFMAYLGDLDVAYGIELKGVRPVEPFALERPGPQSWRYLSPDELEGGAVLRACRL